MINTLIMKIKLFSVFTFVIILFVFVSCGNRLPNGFLTKEQAKRNIENILDSIRLPQIFGDTINLITFSGFKPDMEGTTNFQPFIKKAIDSLASKGGGWLLFPNTQDIKSWLRYTETYRINGPVEIKSNIGIIIDRSVRLFFPFNPSDYLVNGKGVLTRYEGTTIYSFSPLIRAFNQENIVIKSRGKSGALPVIDGDGEKWQQWMWKGEAEHEKIGEKPSYQLLKEVNNADIPIAQRVYINPSADYFRPETMEFFLCKNILIDGIKITNSPFWCVKPVFSESCTFRNMQFDAMAVNNDGIDPESSRNILIENIMFANHDDNVAIKAGRDKEGRDGALVKGTELENIKSLYIKNGRITGPTENVVIRNCHFHGHHAICIGSEMSGSVRNIYAVDNYSVGEVNMGIFIKSSRLRGGVVENIYINGLQLNSTKNEVISIVPNYDKADQSPYPPFFRNIQIENVQCKSSKSGILIHGWSDSPVENVMLRNISLSGVFGRKLLVNQSANIRLQHVTINDTTYNEVINNSGKDDTPPGKI